MPTYNELYAQYETEISEVRAKSTSFEIYQKHNHFAELFSNSVFTHNDRSSGRNDLTLGSFTSIRIYTHALEDCGSNFVTRQLLHEKIAKEWVKIGQLKHITSIKDGDFSKLYDPEKSHLSDEAAYAYQKATEFYKIALSLALKNQNGYDRTFLGLNAEIAQCYEFQRNWKKASEHFLAAQTYAEKIKTRADVSYKEQRDLIEKFKLISTNGALAVGFSEEEIFALTFADKTRAQLLAKALGIRSTGLPIERYNDLKDQLNAFEEKLSLAPIGKKRLLLSEIIKLREELEAYNIVETAPIDTDSVTRILDRILSEESVLLSTIISTYQGLLFEVRLADELFIRKTAMQDSFALNKAYDRYVRKFSEINLQIEREEYFETEQSIRKLISELAESLLPLAQFLQRLAANKDIQKIIITHSSKFPNFALAGLNITENEFLVDRFELSYLPNISTARNLITLGTSRIASQVAVVAKPNETQFQYSAVDSCFLENVICKTFGSQRAKNRKLTIETILSYLDGKAIWHFSGHGAFNFSDPMCSSLDISRDEKIYLQDFADAYHLQPAKLSMLTSCESGLSDQISLENEFIGWPTAFMQMGVQGVVATLWRVASMPTSLLVCKFYENFIINSYSASRSLRLAQIWLKDSTVSDMLKQVVDWRNHGYISDNHADVLRSDLTNIGLPQFKKPFPDHYYWAGFVYHGLPSLYFS